MHRWPGKRDTITTGTLLVPTWNHLNRGVLVVVSDGSNEQVFFSGARAALAHLQHGSHSDVTSHVPLIWKSTKWHCYSKLMIVCNKTRGCRPCLNCTPNYTTMAIVSAVFGPCPCRLCARVFRSRDGGSACLMSYPYNGGWVGRTPHIPHSARWLMFASHWQGIDLFFSSVILMRNTCSLNLFVAELASHGAKLSALVKPVLNGTTHIVISARAGEGK